MRQIDAEALFQTITTEKNYLSPDNAISIGMIQGLELARTLVLVAPTVQEEDKPSGLKWLYSETEDPSFRICMKCGRAYRIHENDGPFHYCPNCGELLEDNQ